MATLSIHPEESVDISRDWMTLETSDPIIRQRRKIRPVVRRALVLRWTRAGQAVVDVIEALFAETAGAVGRFSYTPVGESAGEWKFAEPRLNVRQVTPYVYALDVPIVEAF